MEPVDIPPIPKQKQNLPGLESEMIPRPLPYSPLYRASGRLEGKIALITGGDSGIGRSVAIYFALEGASVAIVCLPEEKADAEETKSLIQISRNDLIDKMIEIQPNMRQEYAREKDRQCYKPPTDPKCSIFYYDVRMEENVQECVKRTMEEFGKIDILVNNAGVQFLRDDTSDIDVEGLETTFQANIFAYIYFAKAVEPHMKEGSCIINCSSVTAYKGHKNLLDYSSSKGAIISFTRSLALNMINKVRVNAVAPGPIWTPLIPASFSAEKVEAHGKSVPMKRYGQPCEVAPSFVFLASNADSSYFSGQVLHPNGGEIVSS